MTLKQLFQKRYTLYIKNLLKYARIIINDHFVLIFFILIGAGGYTYSQFLETVTEGMVEPRLLVGLLFFFVASTGSVTLLVEPADRVFLLPKEREFKQIFKQSTLRSFIGQLITSGIVTFVTFPIFVATLNVETSASLFIFATLASLKGLNLLVKIQPFFQSDETKVRKNKQLFQVIKLIVIFSLLFIHIEGTAIVVTLFALFAAYQFFTEKLYFQHFFKWETMIEKEEQRLQRIYRFIQMFVNVPHMETKIRRLSWLDKPLAWLSKRYPKAPYYFILRTTARNTEYSLLILRVTIIGMLLLAVTASFPTGILLMVLFLYMIGFQLLTLINDVQRTPQFRIYPVSEETKEASVFRLIFQVLTIVSIPLALAAWNGQGITGLTLLPIGILFAYLFSSLYAPKRINRVKR